MKTLISTRPLATLETPLLAVIVAQGQPTPLKDASLDRAIASGDYKGKKDETVLVYGSGKAERILRVISPALPTPTSRIRSALPLP